MINKVCQTIKKIFYSGKLFRNEFYSTKSSFGFVNWLLNFSLIFLFNKELFFLLCYDSNPFGPMILNVEFQGFEDI